MNRLLPARARHGRAALSPIATAACLAGLLAPAAAGAQTAEPPALPAVTSTAAPHGGLGLRQPSLSGSRTGLATEELPASLDVVDSETWQQRGDTRMADIVGRTVGMTPLSASGYSSLSFSARGFTGTNSVGIAEDGVRLSVASSTTPYPADGWGYERVEVLRGPASILYGSGTVGGTVNVVRKQPSREVVREALVGAGSHGSARLGLGAAGPLGETLSYRLDAYGHTTSGERDLGRASGGKLMSTLRWQPEARVRLELLADVSDQKPERYFGTPALDGAIVPELRRSNFNSDDSTITIRDKRVRARASWQVSDQLTLRDEAYHFSADRHWKNIEAYRYEPASQSVTRSDYLEIGHDLRQSGNRLEAALAAGAHSLVLGWEASRARFSHDSNTPYRPDPAGTDTVVSAFDPQRGQWASLDATLTRYSTEATTHDLYVEDAWRLGERFTLLAGLRRDVTDMQRRERVSGTPFDKTLAGTAWRLGATWKLGSGTHVYAQASQGHDPVTNILTLNLANRDFQLTRARQAEVGIKQTLAQGLGEWTAALYRIEKKDIITRDPAVPSLSVQGGRQHSQGLEWSAVLRPHAQWRVEANYAYTDARFGELIEAGGADRSGNRPSNVPRHSANLWGHYNAASGAGAWQASLGVRAVGERFADNANLFRTGGYAVWDAALAWQPRAGTTLRLTLRNLADRLYTYSAVSGTQALLGDGRRVDLSAQFLF
ncbi:TonB-dependent receptor [Pulveribacter suum]|uniref:TonB-dependent siderophore receptor n=1 Tax=Pulveribacter suum TaxID=2116657 RepID=A0A2P1NN73_9BURK|nr:TonB-dependent receptor [Pulveribacter suum]AVP58500.1 TonB-dependent siderophore receptor [Pulveribacter suum]